MNPLCYTGEEVYQQKRTWSWNYASVVEKISKIGESLSLIPRGAYT